VLSETPSQAIPSTYFASDMNTNAPSTDSTSASKRKTGGFTLIEVVMALVITTLVFGTMIQTYNLLCKRALWSGYSLAAQAVNSQQIEQFRGAFWNPGGSTGPAGPTNEIYTNLYKNTNGFMGSQYNSGLGLVTGYTTNYLPLPVPSGNTVIVITNYVSNGLITASGATALMWVSVDTVWPFVAEGTNKFYTNRMVTYFAPPTFDPSTVVTTN
jgi:hypothetical protein